MRKPLSHVDENLKKFATDTQIRYINAINSARSIRGAAKKLGVSHQTVTRSINGLMARAARETARSEEKVGYRIHGVTSVTDGEGKVSSQSVRFRPDGVFDPGGVSASDARDGLGEYFVKGVSTLFGSDGQQILQWVKTTKDAKQRAALIEAAFSAMASDIPRLPPLAASSLCNTALCNLYTMTDCHVGMLAWGIETGADWDLQIAERTLVKCFEEMVSRSPDAHTCIINQLGDWLHFDSLEAVTPTSKHILDADGRFEKVVDSSMRILRRLIDIALMKHQKVIVFMNEGNHDMASSVWLRVGFRALYENEPRVEIGNAGDPRPYTLHMHGKTMVAFHHGHMKKNEQLPLLFAAQYPEQWGSAKKRYVHVGHRHHEDVGKKEHSGMKIVQHPTLAARDAYAARGGWISERQVTAFTYHSEFGEVFSTVVTPEMVL